MTLIAFAKSASVAAAFAASTVAAQDIRCAHSDPASIQRTTAGRIARGTASRAAFVRMHPCPSTGKVSGSCPGWAVDHVIPLAVGGADEPVNMQWLPLSIKSCAGVQCKDRFERHIYSCNWPR